MGLLCPPRTAPSMNPFLPAPASPVGWMGLPFVLIIEKLGEAPRLTSRNLASFILFPNSPVSKPPLLAWPVVL